MHLTLEELKSKYPDIFSEYSSVNEIDWRFISDNFRLSEEFIREFSDKVNWYNISYSQKLSEDFIREFKDKVNWSYISVYHKLSEEFCEEFNIKSNILNSIFYCGTYNRIICIEKDNPNIIYIGCFSGTKPEAIASINSKYSGQEAIDYISKVEECFNF